MLLYSVLDAVLRAVQRFSLVSVKALQAYFFFTINVVEEEKYTTCFCYETRVHGPCSSGIVVGRAPDNRLRPRAPTLVIPGTIPACAHDFLPDGIPQ